MSAPPHLRLISGAARSPVILHVPHASRTIPSPLRGDFALDDAALTDEHNESADTGTDLIAEAAFAHTPATSRPWAAVNRLSRLVVDPERFPDESEAMNRHGRGAVYTRTCLNTPLRSPTARPAASLIDEYFRPYAQAVADLVSDRITATGQAVLIDVHSYPTLPSWFENPDQPRPAVCLGTDAHHTPQWLHQAAQEAFSSVGDVADDTPYAGCYVPLDRYRSDASVSSIMIELRRDLYLDADFQPAPDRVAVLGAALAHLVITVHTRQTQVLR